MRGKGEENFSYREREGRQREQVLLLLFLPLPFLKLLLLDVLRETMFLEEGRQKQVEKDLVNKGKKGPINRIKWFNEELGPASYAG